MAILDYLFCGDTSLTEVEIPEGVESIINAFQGCKKLRKLIIPKSVINMSGANDYDKNPYSTLDCPDLVIYGYSGTTAEQYARKFNIPFINLDPAENVYQLVASGNFDGSHIYTGDDLLLVLSLMVNGNNYQGNWQDKVLVGTNKAGYIDYRVSGSGDQCLLFVNPKLAGNLELLIQHSDSGASIMIPLVIQNKSDQRIYEMNKIPAFYPDIFGDKFTLTNFYDFGQLYMNNYKYEVVKDDSGNHRGYSISFNIYNHAFVDGSVDVYDKNGKLIAVRKIDPWEGAGRSSIVDTLYQGYELIYDTVTLNALSYSSSTFSKETLIKDLFVPEGGYFTVTNNIYDSPGAMLFNGIDMLAFGVSELISFGIGDYDSLSDSISDIFTLDATAYARKYGKTLATIVAEDRLTGLQDLINSQKIDFLKTANKNATEMNMKNAMGILGETTDNILKQLGIDYKFVISQTFDIGESLLIEAMGFPGAALKALFKVDEYADRASQMIQLFKCKNAETYTIITDSLNTDIYGITVDNKVQDSNKIFQVYRVYDEKVEINGISFDDPDNYRVYNICFVQDGKEVEPPTPNTYVRMAKPSEFKDHWCSLYRQEPDGSWKFICYARPEEDTLKFVTDHFSLYALIKENGQPSFTPGNSVDNNGSSTVINTSVSTTTKRTKQNSEEDDKFVTIPVEKNVSSVHTSANSGFLSLIITSIASFGELFAFRKKKEER